MGLPEASASVPRPETCPSCLQTSASEHISDRSQSPPGTGACCLVSAVTQLMRPVPRARMIGIQHITELQLATSSPWQSPACLSLCMRLPPQPRPHASVHSRSGRQRPRSAGWRVASPLSRSTCYLAFSRKGKAAALGSCVAGGPGPAALFPGPWVSPEAHPGSRHWSEGTALPSPASSMFLQSRNVASLSACLPRYPSALSRCWLGPRMLEL